MTGYMYSNMYASPWMAQYGVKGMRWGVRKSDSARRASYIKSATKANERRNAKLVRKNEKLAYKITKNSGDRSRAARKFIKNQTKININNQKLQAHIKAINSSSISDLKRDRRVAFGKAAASTALRTTAGLALTSSALVTHVAFAKNLGLVDKIASATGLTIPGRVAWTTQTIDGQTRRVKKAADTLHTLAVDPKGSLKRAIQAGQVMKNVRDVSGVATAVSGAATGMLTRSKAGRTYAKTLEKQRLKRTGYDTRTAKATAKKRARAQFERIRGSR